MLVSSDSFTTNKASQQTYEVGFIIVSFAAEEIQAQSGQETCPKSYSKKVGEPRFEHRQSGSGPKYLITRLG